jgi:hypothetical protein
MGIADMKTDEYEDFRMSVLILLAQASDEDINAMHKWIGIYDQFPPQERIEIRSRFAKNIIFPVQKELELLEDKASHPTS